MRVFLYAMAASAALASCRKEIREPSSTITGETINSNALAPLPCQSTAFSTNYIARRGQVPPFRFTKTLYSDTRVKTINMLSRAAPNDHFYAPQAYELKGTFTYSPYAAKFKGTREKWEYHSNGSRTSVEKLNLVYNFTFNAAGLCTSVSQDAVRVLKLNYNNPGRPNTLSGMTYRYDVTLENELPISVQVDSRGNPIHISKPWTSYDTEVRYKYDYTKSGGRYNYQPSQYGVTYEYSLLEVMQWVPAGNNPRSGVSVSFISTSDELGVYRRTQSQVYKNLKYDAKKNLVSYTYGDNVLQKTTWYCKP